MPLLTLGSAAYDAIETPFGRRDRALGGSAVYAAFAASYFTESRMVAAVGEDWQPEYSGLLRSRGVDLDGLELRAHAKTMFWSGRYFDDMNRRETLDFQGNVMDGEYRPMLPDSYKTTPYVFLGNCSPKSGLALLDAMTVKPKLVVADTIDFYIVNMRDSLLSLLERVDGLVLNESEATALSCETSSALDAACKLLEMGPRFVVVKRGEYGAFWATRDDIYLTPAFPTRRVIDPTGAGDSFAGALVGSLAEFDALSPRAIKTSLVYATVVASLNVEGFSLERFQYVKREEIDARAAMFREMLP